MRVLLHEQAALLKRRRGGEDVIRLKVRNAIALLLVLIAFAVLIPLAVSSSGGSTSDRLPNLRMGVVGGFHVEITADGRRLLRYNMTIFNTGSGPFELFGARANTSSPMTVTQRIYDSSGGKRDVLTPATMVFAGDTHNHWHVQNLESSELDRLDNGVKVGTLAKLGFCFFDDTSTMYTLPGTPSSPVYTSCGTPPCPDYRTCGTPNDLQVTMGLSVGWSDKYGWNLPLQWIDITGLKSGRYRLYATADPFNWFRESNDADNVTWTDIQLKGNKVNVIARGPHA